ncbi:unnamed protein product [Rotaria socialis]|uniref:Uncharacterized protein n=1 Tax=Rotaria socialis TaxID=392032 RepID=A0A821A395_9BILA|nr:unnamed protein product [Rotaria socialis]CAF3541927.1 unnamed protein product [Rotaria socialis]CAF4509925.1 unnamed protein product [Rotaria socialis]CAF4571197.1 unnamed protein product [Rotaria socialis]
MDVILNIRFQNLLNNSTLQLKINYPASLTPTIEDRYKQFIHQNKHHMFSLNFAQELWLSQFNDLCTINFTFIRLQSIIIQEITAFKLSIVLFRIKDLPNLCSLIVSIFDYEHREDDIYQIIFELPVLRYLKIHLFDYPENRHFKLITPSDKKYSSLKYLVICHNIYLHELVPLLTQVEHYGPYTVTLRLFYGRQFAIISGAVIRTVLS